MRLHAVDDSNRLYFVENVVSDDLVGKLQDVNWQEQDGDYFLHQPDKDYIKTARKAINIDHSPTLKELDRQLRSQSKTIADLLQLDFSYYYTDFWLDKPGWKIPVHTDLWIPCAWQMYWYGEPNTGTTFLWTQSKSDIRHQFDFRPNTGYLMLNMPEEHYQPLQWHGMFEPITQWRFTSYTRLGPYFSKTSYK
jgi:hypothetical protein